MAYFIAAQPLNVAWRHRSGVVVEIVGDRAAGIALEAGQVFAVPDAVADDFEREMGPRPGSAGVSAIAAQQGIIRGLRRIG